ncbi:NHL repeat-containing protein 2 [Sarcoptes scabiei]|nr:NHL repeat-containing protein 2 [Sarcoptes scabiei]
MGPITDENVFNGDDIKMVSEKNRLESFKNWKFKAGKCTKEKMARTGFYHCNIKKENTVRCFFCFLLLDNWTKNDDPQERHLSNNPNCIFAKLNKDQDNLTVSELNLVIQERNKNMIKARFKTKLDEYNAQISELTEIIKQF